MKLKLILPVALCIAACTYAQAKTLIAYYSYTNNTENIVNELKSQIDADVVEITPTEKGVDYAANNYAIGSSLISAIRNNPDSASSYPAIDAVNVNLNDYNFIIIAAPLWWSNMAAPMQTFLFNNGKLMDGKNIALIVSSASSGISGVEGDAKRLIPNGKFITPSLWIRSSQTSNAKSLIQDWTKTINYDQVAAVNTIVNDNNGYTVYSLSGTQLLNNAPNISSLPLGTYIINGNKTIISR